MAHRGRARARHRRRGAVLIPGIVATVNARAGAWKKVGDHIRINGVDRGRIESIEADFETMDAVLTIIPALLYSAREIAWQGKIEGRCRHLTSETMPGHDGPVAWRVVSRLEWGGLPIVVCPAFLLDGFALVSQVPHDVTVLDSEPGRPMRTPAAGDTICDRGALG